MLHTVLAVVLGLFLYKTIFESNLVGDVLEFGFSRARFFVATFLNFVACIMLIDINTKEQPYLFLTALGILYLANFKLIHNIYNYLAREGKKVIDYLT